MTLYKSKVLKTVARCNILLKLPKYASVIRGDQQHYWHCTLMEHNMEWKKSCRCLSAPVERII